MTAFIGHGFIKYNIKLLFANGSRESKYMHNVHIHTHNELKRMLSQPH